MQGRKNQVARQRRAHHQLRRLGIATFAHQNHVGVLPQQRAQSDAEGEADFLLDLRLANKRHAVLDRVLERESAHLERGDFLEHSV